MGYEITNKEKTRKSPIQHIFCGAWAKELGKNETNIYQIKFEVGKGNKFTFWEIFSP